MKSVVWLRDRCIACNHAYLSGEMRVGDIAAHVGMCTPVMHFLMVFHGEVGGTKKAYGPCRVLDSLSGSLSSVTIWRKPLCARRGNRVGEDGGRVTPLEFGGVRRRRVSCCESALAPTSSVSWEAGAT